MYQNQPDSKAKIADVAVLAARPALSPPEVCEEGDLAEPLDGAPPSVPGGDEGVAAAGVDEEARAYVSRARGLGDGRRDAVIVEGHALDRGGLQQRHVRLARGVVEQDLVELGPLDFVGIRGPRLALAEEELVAEIHLLIVEVRAVLHQEPAGLHLVEHPQPFEHREVGGQQRLAHVKARKRLALGQRHREPAAGEERGRARSARAPAHHQHVVVGRPRHRRRRPPGRLQGASQLLVEDRVAAPRGSASRGPRRPAYAG